MIKEELIKDLEELRDVENYSQSELLNTGYRTGLLDALDLVKKYFDLADVIKNEVAVCDCKYPVRVAGDRLLEPYCGKCFKDFKQTVL